MKWRSTLGLAVVLAGLLGAYFYTLYAEQSAVERDELAKRYLDALEPAAIERIVFERPDAQTIEGQRTETGWTIAKPHALPAADPAWDRVAAMLSGIKIERTIEENAEDLTVYELAAPRLTVAFDTKDGADHRFAFGVADPTQRYRFATANDGDVVLIDDKTFQELDRTLDDLRNRFMVGDGRDEIVRMAFTRFKESETWDDTKPEEIAGAEEQVTVAFERGEDGAWAMTLPVKAKASQAKVQAMWEIMQYAVGEQYVDAPESLDDYGLAPAGARFTVGFDSGRPDESVYFGSMKGSGDERRLYAKKYGEPSVFLVHNSVHASLPESPVAFREYRLLTRNIGSLYKYEYNEGGISFTLGVTEGGGWGFLEPSGLLLDQKAFSIYLSFLTEAEGTAFAETAPDNFAEGASITLHFLDADEGEAPTRIVLGGPGPDGDMWLAQQDTGEIMLISQLTRDALRANLFKFEEKRLAPIRGDAVHRVSLAFEGTDYAFEKRDERWVVTAPADKVWERQADMDLLLDALTGADAEALDTTLPADQPVPATILEVRLFGADGDAPLAGYAIGSATPQNAQLRYGQAVGRDRIVHTPQRTIDRVREALRGVVDRN